MKSTLIKVFKKSRSTSKKITNRANIHFNDLRNKIKYGMGAPLYMELIWVDPSEINTALTKEDVFNATGIHRNKASGVIIDWNTISDPYPLTDEYRIQYCHQHWVEGKSWEDLGVIKYMKTTKKYGDWPESKIKTRFEMLDNAYQETKSLGRLKTRKEINPSNFREEDGIFVHINDQGKPVFGGNGFHRLALSKALNLKKVPACVGLVAHKAIPYLNSYRKKPDNYP